jgi:hypothetical protein
MDDDKEEQEAPRDATMVVYTLEDHIETIEPKKRVDPPREATITRKRPYWLWNTLQEVEGHATPKGSLRERKRPHKFSSYVASMSKIIDSEPSTFEEAAK